MKLSVKAKDLTPGTIVDIENFPHHDTIDKLMAAYYYAEVYTTTEVPTGILVHFTRHTAITVPPEYEFTLA